MKSLFGIYFFIGFFINSFVVGFIDSKQFQKESKEYKKYKIAGSICMGIAIALYVVGFFV